LACVAAELITVKLSVRLAEFVNNCPKRGLVNAIYSHHFVYLSQNGKGPV
jgi:hypothetical protein